MKLAIFLIIIGILINIGTYVALYIYFGKVDDKIDERFRGNITGLGYAKPYTWEEYILHQYEETVSRYTIEDRREEKGLENQAEYFHGMAAAYTVLIMEMPYSLEKKRNADERALKKEKLLYYLSISNAYHDDSLTGKDI